ncbi:MAG: hypothetical protein K1X72_03335 [Pyrinomonadaceae bacterium]|nr:hypothetical protein [Pyrinomonadaceae bacterium]
MTGYIGCAGLVLILLFIVLLFVRRKKIEKGVEEFYKKNQFFGVKELPESISQAIGNGNWIYLKSSLVVEHKPFEFYWLESSTTSTTFVNNSAQTTINCFLTIAFPPNTVSFEFMQKAEKLKETEARKLDFFSLNTDKPYRVEKLNDGSFIISWQVLNRADIFQKKIDWLQQNLT